jgi:hypothetical protein
VIRDPDCDAGRVESFPRPQSLATLGLIVGFGIRIALLRYRGTADTYSYEDWGTFTDRLGLARAYAGIYFPLEYQILGFTAHIATLLHLSFVTTLKAVSLVCDGGCLVILRVFLRRIGASSNWALLYWLHPYTLALFWLSYIDFQIGLMVLLAFALLWVERPSVGFLASGIPLGAAFLMKPQAILLVGIAMLVAIFGIVAGFRAHRLSGKQQRRAIAPLLWLVGPCVFFAGYSAYFHAHGHGARYLLDSYTHTLDVAPSLTANMPNIWYPITLIEVKPGEPTYTVTGPHVLHTVGALITIALILGLAWRVFRTWERRPFALSILLLASGALIIAPMTETRAHENHLYLGWLLAIPVAAVARRRAFTYGLIALSAADFLNLFGIYAFGLNAISKTSPFTQMRSGYTNPLRLVDAIVAICAFAVVLVEYYRMTGNDHLSEPALNRVPRPHQLGGLT